MSSPCHPCFNALWISDNPLCTFYILTEVIVQQNFAGYVTGINCFGCLAIITPVAAINLKYSIISASNIAVYSFCVKITFPLGQTHPVRQADSPIAVHARLFQNSGELAPIIDLGLYRDRKEEKRKNEESLQLLT